MKILAMEKELQPLPLEEKQTLLRNEALAVWKFYQEDVIREIYFRADQSTAVLLLECDSVQNASDFLSQLPLVSSGVIKFELIPLKPYSGFSRLF